MKLKLLLIGFLSYLTTKSQDSTFVAYPKEKRSFIYYTIDEYCVGKIGHEVTSPPYFVLIDYKKCDNIISSLFFKIIYGGSYYYIRSEDIANPDSLFRILSGFNQVEKERYMLRANVTAKIIDSIHFERIANAEYAIRSKKATKFLSDIKKYEKYGIMVIDWNVYDESEYTTGTSFQIKIYNASKKAIKYLWVTVTGINAVGDKVYDYARRTASITLKGVGPIEAKETGSYSFDYTWFTDLVERAIINSIKIQYLDGTYKIFSDIKSITVSKDIVEQVKYLDQ